jgi:chromosome segregation ATPase
MNTPANNSTQADLEETAELPQLPASLVGGPGDPLAATDSWESPAHRFARSQESAAGEPPVRSTEAAAQDVDGTESMEAFDQNLHAAEIGALRSNLASVSESRSQLEHDLSSLGGNLRELEQMLNRKSEELSVYEREVGLRDRRIAELEARIAQVDAALATAGADSAFLRDELQAARTDGDAARERITALMKDLTAVQTERATLGQRAQAAELDLAQWRMRGERYRETLQSLEGRRQLYDGVIAERETRIAELDAQIAERELKSGAREQDLRKELHSAEERARELDTVRGRLEAAGAAARERIAALETETRLQETSLRELRAQSGARAEEQTIALRGEKERNAELDAARARADAAAATARERIAALEAQTRLQEQSLRELRSESQQRQEELNTALRAEQERTAELDAARARAEAAAASARERGAALEAQTRLQEDSLRELRAQSQERQQELNVALHAEQERGSELAATRSAAAAASTAMGERIAALESEIRLQEASLRELNEQAQARQDEFSAALRAEQERSAGLDSARAAAAAAAASASERIAALEAEARIREESLRELRSQFTAVRASLAQRNALIERVEAEAASSVVMLGNIQHNLQHLGAAEEQIHLLVRTEGDTGILHLLGRRTTIGRTPDNDLRIDAEFISRHHAVALRSGAKTLIEDLNSTNGTYVNGERITRRTLKDGDMVILGKTEFRFTIKPPA